VAFHLPTFNLLAGHWPGYGTGPLPPGSAPPNIIPCQLRIYKTAMVLGRLAQGLVVVGICMPAHVPVAGNVGFIVGNGDLLEVPHLSQRFYLAICVDDVAKGFPNEYRMATLDKIWASTLWVPYGIPNWPIPIP